MSLLEKALIKIEESKNVGNIIDREKVTTKSNFVGQNNKQQFRLLAGGFLAKPQICKKY